MSIEIEETEDGRRIYRIDVGDLDQETAAAYVKELMEKYKNEG